MASVDLSGSGRFVPVREWTCPKHDQPEHHECDCEYCTWQQPACCQLSRWIDKVDEDGQVVMREMSVWEALLFDRVISPLSYVSGLHKKALERVTWLEDPFMPGAGT